MAEHDGRGLVAAAQAALLDDPAFLRELVQGAVQAILEAEMTAPVGAGRFCDEVGNGYRFAVVNFANPDMVGHTGSIPATVAAVEAADACLGQVAAAVESAGGISLVTSDHGNAEQLLEADGESPHTAHTTNPVPLIVTGPGELEGGGELSDLVPTALALLGLPQPAEMTGKSLLKVS
ncbi:MAG: hypothetical protein WD249_04680 [Gaiellaceae bacterium]